MLRGKPRHTHELGRFLVGDQEAETPRRVRG